jgi:hypothetical protein
MEKQTQGNKKWKQYLEELRRNKNFIADIKRMNDLSKKNKRKKCNELILKISERYGVDREELFFNLIPLISSNEEMIWGDRPDLCVILNNCDYFTDLEETEDDYCYPRKTRTIDEAMFIRAYPISINIHRLASKRDVLDFIEKKWKFIECDLDAVRNGKIRIRARKNPERDNFIWENRNLKIKEIKKLLDEKFPKNGLVYFNIYKIINDEQRRRNKKVYL